MLEYCYAANALSFYHLFFAPHSAVLRRVRAPVPAAAPARAIMTCSCL